MENWEQIEQDKRGTDTSPSEIQQSKNQIAYSKHEEQANIWSHFLGAVLALVGAGVLLAKVLREGRESSQGLGLGALVVYVFCTVLMFAMSALYHKMPYGSTRRVVFRRFDHCSIALLIAGTYAPFMVLGLGGTWGLVIEVIEIVLCVLIVTLNAVNVHKYRVVSIIAYVLMGWMCVLAVYPLAMKIGVRSLWVLGLGGLFYTGGIAFYKVKKIPFNHAIWHLCVLLGALCMWLSIYWFV
ncbi:MAG: hemolysin III family protein [Firmicutes bacterium]|nr:hemolysin III family protein [Bacillota bacterium]